MLLLEPGWDYRGSSPFWLDARFACGVIALKRVYERGKKNVPFREGSFRCWHTTLFVGSGQRRCAKDYSL